MPWSYPVLDPVSQAYPKVQGRSPTCYSPVRHSSHSEKRFPFDLHVLSTPPAFVLSQDQTLQTKTPETNPGRIHNQRKSDHSTTPKTGITKTPHPNTGTSEHGKKQQQTKTTKHTIEFSNNTPALQATLPLYSIWTETSNPVLQSYWPGAVGFSINNTPLSRWTQSGLSDRHES
jgi:hypothetical protein